jgi:hypothetical protein
MIPHN